jgi:DNA-binding beta-propeller fold protein YncE
VVAQAGGGAKAFDLAGNFEPEAFSTDGRELFLLEYIPALAPTRYRVRRLLLEKERVVPIGRLKTAAPGQMQGTGRAQAYSPGADELYTLYTQQDSAGHEAGAISGDHAFVHLLNLEGSWTHCIDLPHTFGHGDATASALAVSPDGARLFVADWTSGVLAVASPEKGKVIETATVAFGEADDRTFAAATDDLLFVAGGAEVVVLDPDSLEVADRWPVGAEVTGLAASEDGSRLYVSTDGQVLTLDTTGGEIQGDLPVEGARGLTHVAPAA